MPMTPEEIISGQDKEKRLEEEKRILEAASNMDNPENSSLVTQWLVKEQIESGKLLRVVVATLPSYRTKEECTEAMAACPATEVIGRYKKAGLVGILGVSGGGTASVLGICYTILRLKGLI